MLIPLLPHVKVAGLIADGQLPIRHDNAHSPGRIGPGHDRNGLGRANESCEITEVGANDVVLTCGSIVGHYRRQPGLELTGKQPSVRRSHSGG